MEQMRTWFSGSWFRHLAFLTIIGCLFNTTSKILIGAGSVKEKMDQVLESSESLSSKPSSLEH